jgi:hypothetical protein
MGFFGIRRLDAATFHEGLETLLGHDAVAYSTVTSTLRSALSAQIESEAPRNNIDDAIVQRLGEIS